MITIPWVLAVCVTRGNRVESRHIVNNAKTFTWLSYILKKTVRRHLVNTTNLAINQSGSRRPYFFIQYLHKSDAWCYRHNESILPQSIPNDIPQKTSVRVISALPDPLSVPPRADVNHGRSAVTFSHERAVPVGLTLLVDLAGVSPSVPGAAVFDFLDFRTAVAVDDSTVDDGDWSGPDFVDIGRPCHSCCLCIQYNKIRTMYLQLFAFRWVWMDCVR